MSSFMRSRAQIPPRESFLLSLSGCPVYVTDSTDSVVNISKDTTFDLSASAGFPAGLSANVLLRDMGRSLTLFADNAASRAVKVAVFREVQIVNGAGTEGVNDVTPYLVSVWADVPTEYPVLVARCG